MTRQLIQFAALQSMRDFFIFIYLNPCRFVPAAVRKKNPEEPLVKKLFKSSKKINCCDEKLRFTQIPITTLPVFGPLSDSISQWQYSIPE